MEFHSSRRRTKFARAMNNLDAILEKWEPVIGLEVHAQLATETKMFCGCKNIYGDPPNSHTCPICLGLPGALPVANEKALQYVLRLGVALGSEITRFSRFARKNYFYPDLPKGYQISQFEEPLCRGGSVTIRQGDGLKKIRLTRIHLEEDAGKSIHGTDGVGTRIDLNRSGVPLVEIVSEPEIQSADEAKEYFARLRLTLEYLSICHCNMEHGNLRCDANISLRQRGETNLGVKTEMKNMNSFRSVERGLEYEIRRQAEILEEGGEVEQVTLLWDETGQKAEIMRTKEESHDYRYFPDPDLVPIEVTDEDLRHAQEALVELPHEKEARFVSEYGLRLDDVMILVSDPKLAEYFEETVALLSDAAAASKWILGEMRRNLKDRSLDVASFPIRPDRFAELLKVVDEGVVNVNSAKLIFRAMLESDETPRQIIEAQGLAVVSEESELQAIIDGVLADSPAEVSRYREGKKSLFGFFMGEVMKKTGGKSDPQVIRKLLTKALDE
ncbi:MAG: Asp-tRNA(Asn)/Glu-tRNA(Gln) amidotransferase subunit GatB [Candidatus Marinimicrobia bacterium]|nr:Asp-tRNA(Asn)/Glu-tRNA(Gln) amidotransferase subunit GatB [Candidatus Neomarinimicrobiota bacterium]MDP6593733.1 Asp-tRNA(Asn)/Glu-tRNA(Gln) amidotransferase subunit GatB [Candidatus Neomarinimicrobiota bacterium]